MRLHWLLGLSLCVGGCASLTKDLHDDTPEDEEVPTEETVYLVPLDEALFTMRRVFEEQRYDVFERADHNELYTSAHEPGVNLPGNRTYERYFVKGASLGPRQSVIRVFRLRYREQDTNIEVKPKWLNERIQDEEKYLSRKTFERFTFEGVPDMEGFKMVRGTRDLPLERKLLAKLEMVPSLELVGGRTTAPVRAVQVEGWDDDTAQPPPVKCGEPLQGVEPLLTAGNTVLVGDPLGTRELPEIATRMLCDAVEKKLPVALALSMPSEDQGALDDYLASAGHGPDLERLLVVSSFWRRVYQDGRSSGALLRLIEQARRLRAQGHAVTVLAFDSNNASGNAREAEMAKNLIAYRQANPDTWLLALAGDVHVRTKPVSWNKDFEPLGWRLTKALPESPVKALEVGFTRGSQFSCRFNVWEQVDCNVFALSPTAELRQEPGTPRKVALFDRPSDTGFHGRLWVGALNASPPVIQRAAPVAQQQQDGGVKKPADAEH
ncbi:MULTISPECIES: hypothetical protein [unclassified Corallococcus]|uniref:hypothetical protein n=1 Tax=unclassified Corallococcus TaxID=2685029 RepID=UPI001A8E5240|nr:MULTISPECIES: hypothetical protein [unclassified Corallococcus]MBN9685317.1 hypothetical protein [Corallococcus sp. NCSPR001]WAS83231.1 hypothetical protein O0N60_28415 [Corallococcus sp. NCRR]